MILALETATDVCSVALCSTEGASLAVAEVLRPRAHAAHLAPLIADVLARAEASVRDLTAVAVSAGPGSYTGLRIGASTAKGLAFTTGAALVAVPTLDALAREAREVVRPGEGVLAALPSRRGEVYAAAFRHAAEGLEPCSEPAALTLDELAAWLPQADAWYALGPGAATAAEVLTTVSVLDPARYRLRAEAVGRLAATCLAEGQTEEVDAFEPAYLKAFEVKTGRSLFDRVPR